MIPNKAFQALACGVPLVRRHAGGRGSCATERARRPTRRRWQPRLRRLAAEPGLADRIGGGGLAAYREHASEAVLGRRARRTLLARRPQLVRVGVAAFGIVFAAAAVLRHRAFASGRFDLGNMAQAVWSTARGTCSRSRTCTASRSRASARTDPILAALAPLWWLWPSPELLWSCRRSALAAGALPVHWLARKHLGDGFHAAALAFVYLAYAPVQWLALSDFHAGRPRDALLLFAWWHLDEERLWAFALLAGAAMATKEHVGLAVARWASGTRSGTARAGGLAIAVVAGAVALVSRLLVVPHFAVEGSSAFAGRYDSPSLDGRDFRYLSELLFPSSSCRSPLRSRPLAAVPELGLNLLFDRHADVPQEPLRGGGRPGPARGNRLRNGAARIEARLPGARRVRSRDARARAARAGRASGRRARRRGAACARARRRAPVSATNGLGAHLSARKRIFSFPVLREATWVVVDERHLTFLDSLKPAGPPPPSGRCAAIRAGGSSSPRTGCSSSGRCPARAEPPAAAGMRRSRVRAAARRSSSAAASGSAQIAYHGVSHGVVASRRQPASPSLARPRDASRASQARPSDEACDGEHEREGAGRPAARAGAAGRTPTARRSASAGRRRAASRSRSARSRARGR